MKILYADFSKTHVEKGTHDSTHHVAQKAVGRNGEHKVITRARPLGMRHIAQEIIDLGVDFGKTGEIFRGKEQFRGLVHPPDVGHTEAVETLVESEGIFAYCNEILVSAFHRIEAGVCAWLHRKDVEDGNLLGQETVELITQPATFIACQCLLEVNVRIIVGGVHTRVGTAAPCDINVLLVQQLRQTPLHCFLHSGVIGLNLPAKKGCPVICQMQEITHVSI